MSQSDRCRAFDQVQVQREDGEKYNLRNIRGILKEKNQPGKEMGPREMF